MEYLLISIYNILYLKNDPFNLILYNSKIQQRYGLKINFFTKNNTFNPQIFI